RPQCEFAGPGKRGPVLDQPKQRSVDDGPPTYIDQSLPKPEQPAFHDGWQPAPLQSFIGTEQSVRFLRAEESPLSPVPDFFDMLLHAMEKQIVIETRPRSHNLTSEIPAKVFGHLPGGCVTVFRFFLKRLQTNPLQGFRDIGIDRSHGRWILVQVTVQ